MRFNRKQIVSIIVLLAISLIFVSILTVSVYAEEPDLDLLDLPRAFGEQINISTFSAGLILTMFLISPFNVCLLLWPKSGKMAIILNFVFLGFFTSIGWIPNYTIILVGLIIAGLYAVKIKGMI